MWFVVMARQLMLPKVRGVRRTKRKGLPPQPRVKEFRVIKQFELLHRPFDLRFRGRLNKWLTRAIKSNKLKLGDILDRKQSRIVRLYLFPQDSNKRWLNQDEVLAKIKDNSKKNLRISLISALIRIWKKDKKL